MCSSDLSTINVRKLSYLSHSCWFAAALAEEARAVEKTGSSLLRKLLSRVQLNGLIDSYVLSLNCLSSLNSKLIRNRLNTVPSWSILGPTEWLIPGPRFKFIPCKKRESGALKFECQKTLPKTYPLFVPHTYLFVGCRGSISSIPVRGANHSITGACDAYCSPKGFATE